MNKWFSNVFLPSLFERAGTNNYMWLSKKQTAICCDNMKQEAVKVYGSDGSFYRHLYYKCKWNDRDVTISYSKLNGCSTICFGLNTEEKLNLEADQAAERKAIEQKRIERIKKHPERLKHEVFLLETKIQNLQENILEDIKDGTPQKYTDILRNDLSESKRQLSLLLSP